MKRWIAVLLITLLALLCGCAAASAGSGPGTDGDGADNTGPADLQVYCFSAGKADAFLFWTENSAVLLDCGEKGFGKEILAFLEEQGITSLDYLIITHFDKDHVGGAAKVINNFSVGTVLQSNCPKDSEEYEKYVKALGNAGLTPVTVEKTMTFTLDGVVWSVDGPRVADYDEDDSNNSSLIVSVTNGDNTLLFTGDAQTERLKEFLSYNKSSYDLLKVPHHGREEPQMEALLRSVSPAWAVITSSDDEPEDAATLAALEAAGAEVYLTRAAPVLITSDGTEMTVEYAA